MLPRLAVAAVTAILVAFTGSALAQGLGTETRTIARISGKVYRFQNNAHFSVFAVTPDGAQRMRRVTKSSPRLTLR